MPPLPRPSGIRSLPILQQLKVLLISDFSNTMTKRIQLELMKRKTNVTSIETRSGQTMVDVANSLRPDLIICPFLTSKVPKEITENRRRPCLIVHPGIAGDRGSSSLDWAIHDKEKEWGVTLLQAADKMDAGDIWCVETFPLRSEATKTGTYVGDVADGAVKCVLESIHRYLHKLRPVPLSYDHPDVRGRLRKPMKDKDRTVNWEMSAEEVSRMIRMSDTQPGALGSPLQNICNDPSLYRLFDAHVEYGQASKEINDLLSRHKPGDLIGKRNGAVLVKTGDDFGVWIGRMRTEGPLHMKKSSVEMFQHKSLNIRELTCPVDYDDIRVEVDKEIAYVHFNFYDGAMDKNQCTRLENVLKAVGAREDIKVVALMGGQRFFSTGIHLNTIETSHYKQQEAWENINKIDDVIATTFDMTDKVTVAVLQGNAGAGGAMMAAACDVVISHPGVLVTPSYKAMGLFGSEYWTYFLPERVGLMKAETLINDTTPLLASTAQEYGLVDYVIGEGKREFQQMVPEFLRELADSDKVETITQSKKETRDQDWHDKLRLHRDYELRKMKRCFKTPDFLNAMTRFVYHLNDDESLATIREHENGDVHKEPSVQEVLAGKLSV